MQFLQPPRGWLTRAHIRAIKDAAAELGRRRRSPNNSTLSADSVDVLLYTSGMVSLRGRTHVVNMVSNDADVSLGRARAFVNAVVAIHGAFSLSLVFHSVFRLDSVPNVYRDDSDDDPITRIDDIRRRD